MNDADVVISVKDLREGMGVAGWSQRWNLLHTPTGCEVSYITHGSNPASPFVMRSNAKALLSMLVEMYEP